MLTPDLIKAYRWYRSTTLRDSASGRATRQHAWHALELARADVARGRVPTGRPRPLLGHGDVLRAAGRTFVIAIAPDEAHGAPWDEEDGHGPVSDWRSGRHGNGPSKAPGERPLCTDHRAARFYDWAAAIKQAKAEGWGLGPDELATLTRKLGRTPTAKQVRAEAVRLDFERMSGWANDRWRYVGVCLFELPRDGEQRSPQHVADSLPFGILQHWGVWGIESDSPDYHELTARELLGETL